MRKYDEKTRKYRRKRQRKYEENMRKYEENRRTCLANPRQCERYRKFRRRAAAAGGRGKRQSKRHHYKPYSKSNLLRKGEAKRKARIKYEENTKRIRRTCKEMREDKPYSKSDG